MWYRGLLLSASQRLVQIERALGRADLASGKAQIIGRRSEAAMTKEDLDGTHVSTGFQQVNGEGVSKAMRRDWFGNIGTLMRPMAEWRS